MIKFREGGSPTKEIIGVQYLRGIASLLVVLHHLYFDNTELGPFGVKIFFVISGFVMWYTTVASKITVGTFWRRRIIRIVPLYWIFLSILVAVALVEPQYLNTTKVELGAAIKSFLFIPHYHAVQNLIAPILIPGWSLNYEMFFYLLFGVALLVRSSSGRVGLTAAAFWMLVLGGFWLQPTNAIAATFTSPAMLLFVDGIGLAIIYGAESPRAMTLGLILICVDTLLRWSRFSGDLGIYGDLDALLPALIVGLTLSVERVLRLVPNVAMHTIGNASYSIYLSHLFFIRCAELEWRHLAGSAQSEGVQLAYFAITFLFAVGGGIVVHYLIERPILVFFSSGPNWRLGQVSSNMKG